MLAASAAVTKTIRFNTTVMIAPPREAVLLAKQAATLQSLSGGRLTLGLGIGWRDDDFEIVGRKADWPRRGEIVEEQIARMRDIWSDARVGPHNQVHPEIMLGGAAGAALKRAGRLADAFIAGPSSAEEVREHFKLVDEAASGKKPRKLCSRYFALGDDVKGEMEANVRAYYIAGGEEFVSKTTSEVLTTPEQIRQAIEELAGTGADELCLWPQVARLDQVDRLAAVVF